MILKGGGIQPKASFSLRSKGWLLIFTPEFEASLNSFVNIKSPSPFGEELLVVGRAGFEPTKALPTDLQSAPFDRFGISPDI